MIRAAPTGARGEALERLFAQAVRPDRRWRLALVAAWLALALFLTAHHVMWRDEVRALSLATQGASLIDMPSLARGYGHPLLWHFLLRIAHDLSATPLVLPGLALLIAFAAIALFALRSRLSLPLVALVLFGGFGAHEYVAVARNYGVAMLLLFLLAALYPRGRSRGVSLGALLFLLCNANVHSVVLAGAFLLFWLGDLVAEEGWRFGAAKRWWLVNAGIAAAGAVLSFLSVWPSVEDAPGRAPRGWQEVLLHLVPGMEFQRIFGNFNAGIAVTLAAVLLIAGSLAAFARRPAALLAAAAALSVLQLLFAFVYPGHYRHVALLIVFFVVLLWLTARGHGGWRDTGTARRAEQVGRIALLALLVAQLPATARAVAQAVRGQPQGEAQALAALLARTGLTRASIIADPDFLIESLPYYAANPTFSVRRGCFTPLVPLVRAQSAPMTPGRLLAEARRIRHATGRPVVILLSAPLDGVDARRSIARGTLGPLVLDPRDIAAFRAATVRLASLREAWGDEAYDVYLLPARDAAAGGNAAARASLPACGPATPPNRRAGT